MRAVSVEDMYSADKDTMKQVTNIELMNRAAHALLSFIDRSARVAIICGGGNNGGDGYALAVLCEKENINYSLYIAIPPISEACMHYYNIINSSKIVTKDELIATITEYDIVVDCIFGIGCNREFNSDIAQITDLINRNKIKVIACDIPSGINGNNGVAVKYAIMADVTVAIQSAKYGHYLNDGIDYCGKLNIADIGIAMQERGVEIIGDYAVLNAFPPRKRNSHKGIYGNLLIIANSNNYVGAGILSATAAINTMGEAAMRAGSGYCKLAVPKSLMAPLAGRITHCSLLSLDDVYSQSPTAIIYGMGIGVDYDYELLEYLVVKQKSPLLIDADGLNALSNHMDLLSSKSCDIILTPHIGEFARLSGLSKSEIIENPINIAMEFANKYQVKLLLKGCTSIITDGAKCQLNIIGSAAQAKAGSGDVLAGVIGGLLARGVSCVESMSAASYICGATAVKMIDKLNEYVITPYDIAKNVTIILGK